MEETDMCWAVKAAMAVSVGVVCFRPVFVGFPRVFERARSVTHRRLQPTKGKTVGHNVCRVLEMSGATLNEQHEQRVALVNSQVEVFWGRGIFRGTVQYKGNIATKRGDWVGVALDQPVGESNGMLFGRRYFQCKEKHGVFVRADKIRFIPSVRCLYDRYHKVADGSYVQETLFETQRPEVKNGPYDPVNMSHTDFARVHSSLADYSVSPTPWGPSQQHHLRQSISGRIPPATRPNFRYQSAPFHTQYSIEDDFISKPSIPKIHMPHSALKKQVRRGWAGSHYVREMTVGTGRDGMKLGQWNDVSA